MRVLFLDDDEGRHALFKQASIGHDVLHVRTAVEAIDAMKRERFDLAALDHDLGGRQFVDSDEEETGYQVAKAVETIPEDKWPLRIIVHSYNQEGARRMVARLQPLGIPVQHAPFGTWKLSA